MTRSCSESCLAFSIGADGDVARKLIGLAPVAHSKAFRRKLGLLSSSSVPCPRDTMLGVCLEKTRVVVSHAPCVWSAALVHFQTVRSARESWSISVDGDG